MTGNDERSALEQAAIALRKMRSRLDSLEQELHEPIAVIGLGCRFPGGAGNPDNYWHLLEHGVDAIGPIPPERWNVGKHYDPDPEASGHMYVREGGFLEKIDQFDPAFFGISPREAETLDPQQRLLLEVSWEALEHAGQSPLALTGETVGVFIGITNNEYLQRTLYGDNLDHIDVYAGLGGVAYVAAGRISHVLGVRGPNFPVDTGCSSSLVALHLAVQSLRRGECPMALVGGVNLILAPELMIFLSRMKALAPDGRCKTFDRSANGFGRSEGCGMVVLKRVSDAQRDEDQILAVIRGSAINHDGKSGGLTVPNGIAQQEVVQKALRDAQLDPSSIQYIECHGTGTSLGDPIEVHALKAVFGADRSSDDPLFLGSVKTNIGHSESAAGIAGFIKVVLSLQRRRIPQHLHFEEWNPHISLDDVPFRIPTESVDWPAGSELLHAGVSSFGVSGINAHIIVESAPVVSSANDEFDRPLHLLPISARSPAARETLARSYQAKLADVDPKIVGDLAHTAGKGRSHFSHRLCVLGKDAGELSAALEGFLEGRSEQCFVGETTSGKRPRIAMLFTGQGSQYPGMAKELYQSQPFFRDVLDRCDKLLRGQLPDPLLEVVFGEPVTHQLDETLYAQPALFALEYALAELSKSWGIEPDIVIGHSVGEYVAACVAGVFSLEAGLELISRRARLFHDLPERGSMAAVFTDSQRVREIIAPYGPRLGIAAFNSPSNTVISGESDAVESALQDFDRMDVMTKRLSVSQAFHSRLVEPQLDALEQAARNVTHSDPKIQLISNLTGRLVQPGELGPRYWSQHARHSVRFVDSIRLLAEQRCDLVLEIGPHPILSVFGQECLPDAPIQWLSSLRRGRADWQQLLESLATLYVSGVEVDWKGFDRDYTRRIVSLPTYPFERKRFWTEHGNKRPREDRTSHPVFAHKTASPMLPGTLWEGEIRATDPDYLAEHVVFGEVAVPGAFYIAMILSTVNREQHYVIEKVQFPQALVLSENETKTLQMLQTPREEGTHFELISLIAPDTAQQSWTTHAKGTLLTETPREGDVPSIDELLNRCPEKVSPEWVYGVNEERGIRLGPRFRWIRSLRLGKREVVGELVVPKELGHDDTQPLHPCLIDSCFQLIAAVALQEDTAMYVPHRLERLEVHRISADDQFWCHALLLDQTDNTESIRADIELLDRDGRLLMRMIGFEAHKATRASFLRGRDEAPADWLYEVEWQPKPRQGLEETPTFLPTAPMLTEDLQAPAEHISRETGFDCYIEALRRLDRFAVRYILGALSELGVEANGKNTFGTGDQLDVIDDHQKYFCRLLDILCEHDLARSTERGWEILEGFETFGVEDPADLLDEYPQVQAELELIRRCGSQLANVLRGTCDPVELLFPEGDVTIAGDLYRDSPGPTVMNRLASRALEKAVQRLPSGRGLRILEVGAGTGGTTAHLLPILDSERCDYLFTDISPHFLAKAKEQFCDYSFLRYELFDIERSPQSQDLQPGRFDVVIAANVLHATRDLTTTLSHVGEMLAPNGLLVALESTGKQAWVDLIFGMMEGWWRFSDHDLRPSHPLLEADEWLELLGQLGWNDPVYASPILETGESFMGLTLLLANAPAPNDTASLERTDWLIIRPEESSIRFEGLSGRSDIHLQFLSFGASQESLEDLSRTLDGIDPKEVENVVLLAEAGDEEPVDSEDLLEDARRDCEGLRRVVQWLVEKGGPAKPQLTIATRGSQAVGIETHLAGLSGALLWGMARTLVREHPEIFCLRIDLDPRDSASAQTLFDEIRFGDGEDQVAFRNGTRLVARLISTNDSELLGVESSESHSKRLEITSRGTLENLQIVPCDRRPPEPGEVEIRVRATGLNFIDVLDALDLLPYDRPGGLGGECAGVVSMVGEGVTELAVGDRVLVMAPGCFSSHVTVPSSHVNMLPSQLSFADAATLPVTFLTAYEALVNVARLSSGQRILIHAAASGTGMAALHIAQWAGAEVFATASPGKWKHLEALGVRHIMNSRNLDFAGEIQEITHGDGVEVVLNSLTGEFIPKSLSVVSRGGHFLEIGKRGIWTSERVASHRPDVSYSVLDLSQVFGEQPDRVRNVIRTILRMVDRGELHPLPKREFPFDKTIDAFRYMQNAKHVGKIVVTQDEETSPIHADATYLITGGTSGLGLWTAEQLVERGAKFLVLLSRRGETPETTEASTRFRSAGVLASVRECDVTDRNRLREVFAEIERDLPPLRGVVHSAGVLDDGMLEGQTWERFERVLGPKMVGAWNLQELTQDLPIDFFILYSSAASLLGPSGQANHAAANAFLDQLAWLRRRSGLSALSINWGPWSGLGAFAKRSLEERIDTHGVGLIRPEDGARLFDRLWKWPRSQVSVIPIDWPKFLQNTPWVFFEECSQADAATKVLEKDQLAELHELPKNFRRRWLQDHVRIQTATILGMSDPETILISEGFSALGMDSLTSVELRNRLRKSLALSLPTTLTFDYPTIEALADYLASQLLGSEVSHADERTEGESKRSLELDALSKEEMIELLAQKIVGPKEGG